MWIIVNLCTYQSYKCNWVSSVRTSKASEDLLYRFWLQLLLFKGIYALRCINKM